ncbi:ATP-binding protein [Paraburkholderia guartelaensis]|uniref:ATP-binding protein n=1 Tax=Paraburkholderia guartelaensis TaxID=2546446 RepID=A0A4R5L126_9BURK|nr:AAA family ATPase [Paraburkholderia guartelaensis]TDG02176.1 ATP-binding protein [Paraburkholderia guartelaensis]
MMSRGSEWHRWEPHIHGPGTVLNNQFGGGDPWDTYLTALESCSPVIEALAVADYYTTDTYEEVVRRKAAGSLPNVKFLLPNVELRLDIAAKKGFVNVHLLVNPTDLAHVEEIKRFLSRLQFNAFDDRFDCTKADLIRLGKASDSAIRDDRAALVEGATQFKVNFDSLRKAFKESAWANNNILIAIAGGEGDGTSGVRQAADKTIRQELEKFTHVIFASSPAQREFWLGKRTVSLDQMHDRYGGCKPCLHGSDAHDLASIGKPEDDRFSWIKGALTFDSLKQACIDPDGRAYVGREPPTGAMPSQVISDVQIFDAPWAATKVVPLNPGLVAIIGARGSGKTALADMIAAGCEAISEAAWAADGDVSPSFLVRARPLIGEATVKLGWGSGDESDCYLDGRDANDVMAFPRARYLSQQFVEELCSSKGASEGLVREIERVIFEAHAAQGHDGAYSFEELRDQRTTRFRHARRLEDEAIVAMSDRIAEELEKEAIVSSLATQVAAKEKLLAGYAVDQSKLVVKGAEAQVQRHTDLTEAAQAVSTRVNALANQRRTFVAMQDEVKNTRTSKAPEMLRQAMARHPSSGLNQKQWDDFLMVYQGNVDTALADYVAWADAEIIKLNGVAPPEGDPAVPLIRADADLKTIQLAVLKAEMARLEKRISADTVVRNQYTTLSKKIATEKAALQALKTRSDDAKGATERRKTFQQEREVAYGRLFDAVVKEQNALTELYAPLMKRLGAMQGTLKKLSFKVSRIADVARWASVGEDDLIDCRKAGDFYGRGSLENTVRAELLPAWETGTAAEVQTAMSGFIAAHYKALRAQAPLAPAEQEAFRQWSKRFAHWLFSTDHIAVRYEILYDGIDIRKLSPGTRGIVLLLLYLALDDADDRPLIIDQPEENLDPKSVFDELVSLFISAKSKRQVIMVTHNANLVINTDADQVIVANASSPGVGGLPSFTYTAGGLEDAEIRKVVCDILEGGEKAFRERARRLRVRLER